ncbi:polysaccharide biosynthesis protein [Thalassobacillus hwangdonensis]|uniref:Polysaccharide biosynthesis protein n=1 Tax=Thalassobacillus hwangdonensis TaxID=546108 RepID=A0ABW3L4B1_9BACI
MFKKLQKKLLIIAELFLYLLAVLLSYILLHILPMIEISWTHTIWLQPFIIFAATLLYLTDTFNTYPKDVSKILFQSASLMTLAYLFYYAFIIFHPPLMITISSFLSVYLISVALISVMHLYLKRPSISSIANFSKVDEVVKVLIIGAGTMGTRVVDLMHSSVIHKLEPIGFIDDDSIKHGTKHRGIPIFGGRTEIEKTVKKYGVKQIVIAMPAATPKELADITNLCNLPGVEVSAFSSLTEIAHGRNPESFLKKVKAEDLLGRDSVQTYLKDTNTFLQNKTVLITGAGGSIGSELCKQVSSFQPKQLVLVGSGEGSIYTTENQLKERYPELVLHTLIANIRDRERIDSIFSFYRPDIVFHAAAHKHVPLMEENPLEAVKNNIFGTKNVADAAHRYHVSNFVLISTDKAVRPTSIMGATKRVAELYIQSINERSSTKYSAVRFGNVLGSRGSVVPLFESQIAKGGPVTVTHKDMVRYFMTIPEAVLLVIDSCVLAEGGEIFILDMGKPMKIYELAERVIELSGLRPHKDIQIKITGIRKGEKLYEELVTDEEGVSSTRHPLIFKANPPQHSSEQFDTDIFLLERKVFEEDVQFLDYEIKQLMKQLVPTFQGDQLS